MANEGTIMSFLNGVERDPIHFDRSSSLNVADRSFSLTDSSRRKYYVQPSDQIDYNEFFETPVLALSPSDDNIGALNANMGSDYFFERVWVIPSIISLGFITEDTVENVEIWNAFRNQTTDVTDISVVNQDGTSLSYPTPLPDTVPTFGDAIYVLTVSDTGPPLQDTTYTITVNGVEYDIYITGIRVIPFDPDPNWDAIPEIHYEFSSTIYTSQHFQEQRRPISDESWINVVADYDAGGDKGRKLFNLLGYCHDKVVGVPIYCEKLTPSSATQGSSYAIVNEDMTYYYNAQKLDYVIIVDHENGTAEVKEISSLTAPSQINFSQSIVNTFDLQNTYIYPCVFCVISAYRSRNRTDDLDTVGVEFREFKNG